MNILMLHNYYQCRGGEDVSTEAEAQLLRNYGHRVDLKTVSNQAIAKQSSFTTAVETIWSKRALYMVRELLQQQRYDMVHVQNFFPRLSTSIYLAAKEAGIPLVQALRNYRLLCLNALLFRNDHICEKCIKMKSFLPGLFFRCYRNSFKASFIVAAMLLFNKGRKTWQTDIDMYYSPSLFAAQKLQQVPIPPEKIINKPNFVVSNPSLNDSARSHVVFIGRMTKEKGFDLLLHVFNRLKSISLTIVGLREKSFIGEYPTSKNIHYYFDLQHDAIVAILKQASFLIMPSRCYETFGRVLIEAFACGTPVIAAHLGAMAEIVEHGRTGLLFEPGNADDLAAKVEWAWSHPKQMAEMGREARHEYERKYTPERNYQMLMDIYQKAIENHRQRH